MQRRNRFVRPILAAASALSLMGIAGCSDPVPPQEPLPGTPAVDPVANTPPPSPAPAPATTGGDGSNITLNTLGEADIEGKLEGELRCSFALDPNSMILLAAGNVDKSERTYAVINNGGVAEDLQSTGTGGYDGMVEGVTFGGRGLSITIAAGEEQKDGTEQVKHAATLKVQRADGAERTYTGAWTCGP